MRTYSVKPKDISRQWYLIDAQDVPLGRLATQIARLLIGKHKTRQSPHMDSGDFVVVINSDKLQVSGDKENSKVYYRHSGFPGGLKSQTLGQAKQASSQKVLQRTVAGMLPVNKLRVPRLKRLKIYADEQHQHKAQNPTPLSLKGEST